MRWQPLVQLGVQVVVQDLAYGITFIFIRELRSHIQDVLEVIESLPGRAVDAPDPGGLFGGDR